MKTENKEERKRKINTVITVSIIIAFAITLAGIFMLSKNMLYSWSTLFTSFGEIAASAVG